MRTHRLTATIRITGFCAVGVWIRVWVLCGCTHKVQIGTIRVATPSPGNPFALCGVECLCAVRTRRAQHANSTNQGSLTHPSRWRTRTCRPSREGVLTALMPIGARLTPLRTRQPNFYTSARKSHFVDLRPCAGDLAWVKISAATGVCCEANWRVYRHVAVGRSCGPGMVWNRAGRAQS
jgi:hypothetical protein